MSKHFSELKFEIIQVDNQDYFEQNGSTVDMVVQNIIRHKEEACGDVEIRSLSSMDSIFLRLSSYDASAANM